MMTRYFAETFVELCKNPEFCLELLKEIKESEYKSDLSKLYYEAHITIEPVFDERRTIANFIACCHGFKLADLLMKKRKEDTEERSSKDTFMTGHSKSFKDLEQRTKECIIDLQKAGFKVWRYKIEDTILDSRTEDVWGVLTTETPKAQDFIHSSDSVLGFHRDRESARLEALAIKKNAGSGPSQPARTAKEIRDSKELI